MVHYISHLVVLLFLMTVILSETSRNGRAKKRSRQKRYLVFPRGGSYKMVIGIGIPIKIGNKQSMAVGWNFQAQYALPTNITALEQYPPNFGKSSVEKRQVHESERAIIYKALEDVLENEGFNGRECILRSICENAVDSLHHDANGLYGELLHIIFTPTYGDGENDTGLDLEYLEAQKAGEYGIVCETLYTGCCIDSGFLGLFSVIEDELGFG